MVEQLVRIKGSTWCIVPYLECWGRIRPRPPKWFDPNCTGIISCGEGFRPPRRIRKALKMARKGGQVMGVPAPIPPRPPKTLGSAPRFAKGGIVAVCPSTPFEIVNGAMARCTYATLSAPRCRYCGTRHLAVDARCLSCGAPL